jgi:hypothetical protein
MYMYVSFWLCGSCARGQMTFRKRALQKALRRSIRANSAPPHKISPQVSSTVRVCMCACVCACVCVRACVCVYVCVLYVCVTYNSHSQSQRCPASLQAAGVCMGCMCTCGQAAGVCAWIVCPCGRWMHSIHASRRVHSCSCVLLRRVHSCSCVQLITCAHGCACVQFLNDPMQERMNRWDRQCGSRGSS